MISACASKWAARCVISPKLPIGVDIIMSIGFHFVFEPCLNSSLIVFIFSLPQLSHSGSIDEHESWAVNRIFFVYV